MGAGLFAQFGARVTTSLLLAHSGVPRNRKPFAVVGAVRGLRSRLRLRQNNQANALRIEGFARRTWIPNPTRLPSEPSQRKHSAP